LLATLAATSASLYNLTAIDINGTEVNLDRYKGKVSLVVNMATY
jgi:glutathione peroxidase-family protein